MVAAVIALGYGLYKYLKPDYLEDFDDEDFDDDEFDEDFFDVEDEEADV